jgi:hypothetical protein
MIPQMSTAETEVTVWCGTYRVDRHDPFFSSAVNLGRRYVDPHVRGKQVPEDAFHAEVEVLRKAAPANGQVLLDELQHRWAYPSAAPALYALTCEVCVPADLVLIGATEELGRTTASTKIGKAARSLAPRLVRYDEEGIAGVHLTKGSLVLRLVVYGHGQSMIREGELKQVASRNAPVLERADELGNRRQVTTESYAGAEVVNAICAYARGHESVQHGAQR